MHLGCECWKGPWTTGLKTVPLYTCVFGSADLFLEQSLPKLLIPCLLFKNSYEYPEYKNYIRNNITKSLCTLPQHTREIEFFPILGTIKTQGRPPYLQCRSPASVEPLSWFGSLFSLRICLSLYHTHVVWYLYGFSLQVHVDTMSICCLKSPRSLE